MPKRTLLCIDYNNILYRSVATHMTLFSEEIFTGGLYGFIKHLCFCINEIEATHVVICKDSPPYIRQEEYPYYKASRSKDANDDFHVKAANSKAMIDDFLSLLNVPIWEIEGFEADDMMAYACMKYRYRFSDIVLGTNDSDLYQMLYLDNVCLFKGSGKGRYGYKEFKEEFPKIEVEEWVLISALVGTHNEVEGIKGIGPAKAVKVIRNEGDYGKVYNENKDLIKDNIALIDLPHGDLWESPNLKSLRGMKGAFKINKNSIFRFFGKYDMVLAPYMKTALESI